MTMTPANPAIPSDVVEILIRIVATVGEGIALAIMNAIKAGDVDAVQQLTATGLEDAHVIALTDAALKRSQAAKFGA